MQMRRNNLLREMRQDKIDWNRTGIRDGEPNFLCQLG